MEETHFLVWQEGEDEDGGENGEGEESRKSRKTKKSRDEQRPKDGNQGVAEVPPPTLHPVKAAEIVHYISLEEVERGDDGGAVEERVGHHSEEQSS